MPRCFYAIFYFDKRIHVMILCKQTLFPERGHMDKISNNSKSGIRPLESLNVIDSFLFQEITEDEENAKFIAKLIIKRVTGVELTDITVEVEKSLHGIVTDKHGIRLDIRVLEKNLSGIARIHNIEPNAYKEYNLPYRSRYYQSLTDAKYLGNSKKYIDLPEVITIWILEHDPFGGDRIIYNVKNVIEEMPEMLYNDGVKRIFLYTKGKIGGTRELKNLLKYISESNPNNVVDTELEALHGLVDDIKHREGIGERYMTLGEMIEYERAESYENGVEAGRQEGRQEGMEILVKSHFECNIPETKTIQILMDNYDLSKKEATDFIASSRNKN